VGRRTHSWRIAVSVVHTLSGPFWMPFVPFHFMSSSSPTRIGYFEGLARWNFQLSSSSIRPANVTTGKATTRTSRLGRLQLELHD
jgi:hypothetical protein